MKRHITLVLGSLLLVGLASCSSAAGPEVATAGGATAASGSAAPVSEKEAALKYVQCMRENGVPDFEDPKFDGNGDIEDMGPPDGVDRASLDAAHEKCRKHLPAGGTPEKPNPEDLKKLQAHATCMRENGVPKFPDPDPNGSPGRMEGGLDPDSTEFKAAHEKCRHHMPGGGGFLPGSGK